MTSERPTSSGQQSHHNGNMHNHDDDSEDEDLFLNGNLPNGSPLFHIISVELYIIPNASNVIRYDYVQYMLSNPSLYHMISDLKNFIDYLKYTDNLIQKSVYIEVVIMCMIYYLNPEYIEFSQIDLTGVYWIIRLSNGGDNKKSAIIEIRTSIDPIVLQNSNCLVGPMNSDYILACFYKFKKYTNDYNIIINIWDGKHYEFSLPPTSKCLYGSIKIFGDKCRFCYQGVVDMCKKVLCKAVPESNAFIDQKMPPLARPTQHRHIITNDTQMGTKFYVQIKNDYYSPYYILPINPNNGQCCLSVKPSMKHQKLGFNPLAFLTEAYKNTSFFQPYVVCPVIMNYEKNSTNPYAGSTVSRTITAESSTAQSSIAEQPSSALENAEAIAASAAGNRTNAERVANADLPTTSNNNQRVGTNSESDSIYPIDQHILANAANNINDIMQLFDEDDDNDNEDAVNADDVDGDVDVENDNSMRSIGVGASFRASGHRMSLNQLMPNASSFGNDSAAANFSPRLATNFDSQQQQRTFQNYLNDYNGSTLTAPSTLEQSFSAYGGTNSYGANWLPSLYNSPNVPSAATDMRSYLRGGMSDTPGAPRAPVAPMRNAYNWHPQQATPISPASSNSQDLPHFRRIPLPPPLWSMPHPGVVNPHYMSPFMRLGAPSRSAAAYVNGATPTHMPFSPRYSHDAVGNAAAGQHAGFSNYDNFSMRHQLTPLSDNIGSRGSSRFLNLAGSPREVNDSHANINDSSSSNSNSHNGNAGGDRPLTHVTPRLISFQELQRRAAQYRNNFNWNNSNYMTPIVAPPPPAFQPPIVEQDCHPVHYFEYPKNRD